MKLVATRLLTAKEVSFRISDNFIGQLSSVQYVILMKIALNTDFFCYKINEEKTIFKGRQIGILELIGRYQKAKNNVLNLLLKYSGKNGYA